MLISETVNVKWYGVTKPYYENLGYKFTKFGDEFEVPIKHLLSNSSVKVDVQCEICYKSKQIVYKQYTSNGNKYYCASCAKKLINHNGDINNNSGKYKKSFYNWCIENNRNDLLDRWDNNLNIFSPQEVAFTSSGLYYFICPRKIHKSEQKRLHNIISHDTSNCNSCISFGQWCIDNFKYDVLALWDYRKNKISPFEVNRKTHTRYYFICDKCKDNSEIKCLYNIVEGNMKNYTCKNCYSLGSAYPDSVSVWSDKNKESCFDYMPMSNKKVFWKCENGEHEDYLRAIGLSTRCDYRCPTCVQNNKNSLLQDKIRKYIESLGYSLLHENFCTLKPRSPLTNCRLYYDNEIFDLKLIIECHGEQHYVNNRWNQSNKNEKHLTQTEALKKRQLYDKHKEQYAKSKNFNYLIIPYWEDDSEETWKKSIDSKIQQILQSTFRQEVGA